MSKKHNFSAGPCILPQEVMEQASKSVLEFDNYGLSLLEMSHRDKKFVAVMEDARQLVKELLGVEETHDVLFLQGGASLGFYITALNLLPEGGNAGYINTGTWASNAIKEAEMVGNTHVLASSKDLNFNYIPKGFDVPANLDYLHFTSNNTIFGTQFKEYPSSPGLLVADMSSDIFSRPFDASKFDMIYAGAQKNMGPAGSTLYVIRKGILGKTGRKLPSMLDLEIHIKKDSMFNTPPVFPIYVAKLTLDWIKKMGGMQGMFERNEAKASLLYNEIDRNPLFKGTTAVEDRSSMNATFVLTDESLKDTFDAMWTAAGVSGITGHRSVGGYRASMYNALPIESVQVLVDVMVELEKKHNG